MKISDQDTLTVLDKCTEFLQQIGIQVFFQQVEGETFLPGLQIQNGKIIVDREVLLYPGDILHEAGHIAVVPKSERARMNQVSVTESKHRESEEMMAIAWSYAACVHLGLDPCIVFHEHGYKGGGKNIVDNFQSGHFFGTPMLQWCGMTIEPRRAGEGENAFPKMLKWLRD